MTALRANVHQNDSVSFADEDIFDANVVVVFKLGALDSVVMIGNVTARVVDTGNVLAVVDVGFETGLSIVVVSFGFVFEASICTESTEAHNTAIMIVHHNLFILDKHNIINQI